MKHPQKLWQLWMSCTFTDWLTYTTFISAFLYIGDDKPKHPTWILFQAEIKIPSLMKQYSLISHNINTTRWFCVGWILPSKLLWAVLKCQHFPYQLLLFSSGIYLYCQRGNSAPPIESLLACFLLITVCGPAPLPSLSTSADIDFLLTSPSLCTV